jgi:hypothetical protein
MMFLVMPRPRGPNRWVVAEVYEDGTRQVVERFETEAAAMQHRRDLQDRADRVERAAPPPVPSKPAAPRKPHTGRWVDAPVVALIGALAVAWAMPAAAQRSPLFMCLQLAPAGLSVETILTPIKHWEMLQPWAELWR